MRSNAVQEMKEKASEQLEVAKGKVVEMSRESGRRIDEHARKKPWYYVGFAAFFSVVFGFLLGRKTKR